MPGKQDDAAISQAYREHRPYLVDLAFRMLGDIGAAEDVVQDAFARLLRTGPGEIDDEVVGTPLQDVVEGGVQAGEALRIHLAGHPALLRACIPPESALTVQCQVAMGLVDNPPPMADGSW